MRSIPKLAVALGALVVAFVAVSVYLFLELGQRSDTLASTRTTLAATESANVVLQTEKAGLEGSLENANAQNAALAQANDGLAQDKAVLEGNVAEALDAVEDWTAAYETSQGELQESRTAYDELDAEHVSLSSEHNRLNTRYSNLTTEHRRLNQAHDTLSQEYDDLIDKHSALTSQHRELVDQYDELVGKAGVLTQLEQQIATLEAEIRRLREQRKPLILSPGDSRRSGFVCTGSMTPAFTCLDEATWLSDFDPADIIIGTTISFAGIACWSDETEIYFVAHRVIDIKVEDGVRYYWPKGDHNLEADGCWLSGQDVYSYMIEIHRNARPENAELQGLMIAAKNAYNEARAAYYELHDRYCRRGAQCTVDESIYVRLIPLWHAMNAAGDLYDCWADVAKDSEYPGHIPRRC